MRLMRNLSRFCCFGSVFSLFYNYTSFGMVQKYGYFSAAETIYMLKNMPTVVFPAGIEYRVVIYSVIVDDVT